MPHVPLADRPAVRSGEPSTLDRLAAERDLNDEREDALRIGLRAWAQDALGSTDRLVSVVAERLGCSTSHVRNSLYGRKSAAVIDMAVQVYREHRAATPAEATPEASEIIDGALRALPVQP